MIKNYIAIALASLLLTGCSKELNSLIQDPTLQGSLAQIGVNPEYIKNVATISQGVTDASEEFTQEQEYYIGRTVSANILTKYKIYNNPNATKYINQIGHQLVNHSTMPLAFNGYHFSILDTNEINAFAAPGGYIFITKGLLRCATNEDEVAAILAHEVAHITHSHAISAIKSSRWSDLGISIAAEVAKKHTKASLKNLLNIYDGAIKDITNTMINNGYSKSQEYEADTTATKILLESGYNPSSIVDMLYNMKKNQINSSGGFLSTHPSTDDRVSSLSKLNLTTININPNRVKRFKSNLSKI